MGEEEEEEEREGEGPIPSSSVLRLSRTHVARAPLSASFLFLYSSFALC